MTWWRRIWWRRFWRRWQWRKAHAFVPIVGDPVWRALEDAGLVPPEIISLRIDVAMEDVVRVSYECYCPREVLEVASEMAQTNGQSVGGYREEPEQCPQD